MNIGTIIQWGSDTLPTGWLLCDGSAVSRTTYADLFAVIGTNFGTGDGSTTFNLPDLRGKVGVGKSSDTEFDTLGETGGEKTHTLTTDEMPSHSHNVYSEGGTSNRFNITKTYASNMEGVGTTGSVIAHNGGGQAHNNLQPYIVTNYIIKALAENIIKISELDSAISLDGTEVIPIVQSGVTKKVATSIILDKNIYKANDTFTTGNSYACGIGGFLTGAQKSLCFDIILPKGLDNITTITVNALRIRARSVAGTYLLTNNSANYADLITNKDSGGTDLQQICTAITATKISNCQIRIIATFNAAIYTTNNMPVAVEFRNIGLMFS